MRNIIYFIFILLFFLVSCLNNKEQDNKTKQEINEKVQNKQEPVNEINTDYLSSTKNIDFQKIDLYELNKMTVRLLEQGKFESKLSVKDSLFRLAVLYSSKIIERDSTFIYAYVNKSVAYTGLKKYNNAIDILSSVKKQISVYPDATFRMGIISEKMGNDSIAQNFYKKAFDEYQEYLISPNATAADDINFEFLYLLLEGKGKALKRIEGKLKSSPNNQTYLTLAKNFQEFNREEYIKNFQ
ncbi:MAG: tetratricopeptide repeat protein [Salinivirgaceae bacterium]